MPQIKPQLDDVISSMIEGINRAVEKEATKIYDLKIAELNEELNKSKAEIIAGAVLFMQNHVSVQTRGLDLVITVKKDIE